MKSRPLAAFDQSKRIGDRIEFVHGHCTGSGGVSATTINDERCLLRMGDVARLALINRAGLDAAISRGWVRVVWNAEGFQAIDARDAIALKHRLWGN
jgi:hypothetical protein